MTPPNGPAKSYLVLVRRGPSQIATLQSMGVTITVAVNLTLALTLSLPLSLSLSLTLTLTLTFTRYPPHLKTNIDA